MDDAVITQAVLTFFCGVLAALVIGGLTGWRNGFFWGVGTGCVVIGAAGLAAAGWLGYHRFQSLSGTEYADGVVVEWQVQPSDGDTAPTSAPLVRFRAKDGKIYRVKGLGRSDEGLGSERTVRVRYRPEDPNQAIVADFQNLWGGVWALALFGVIPGMMGAFFVAMAIAETRGSRSPIQGTRHEIPSARRSVWGQRLTVTANILFLASFVLPMFGPESVAQAVGLTFIIISLACVIHAVAWRMRDADDWQPIAILVLLAVSFSAFGIGGYMLGE